MREKDFRDMKNTGTPTAEVHLGILNAPGRETSELDTEYAVQEASCRDKRRLGLAKPVTAGGGGQVVYRVYWATQTMDLRLDRIAFCF